MPRTDHHAIVVGLARYPGLAEPPDPPADLEGPEHDADAIADWLTSTTGGDVAPANVKIIKSSDFPQAAAAGDAKPALDDIQRAFARLDDSATDNEQQRRGRKVGRRLYVYMAGHGFSPRRNHGCLFVSNATPRMGFHIYPSSWLEWFQDAAYFDEFVLWMDCCMNRMTTMPLLPAPALPLARPSPAGPTFIAFAAQRPLKAVEREFEDDPGKVHGVFTWTLLQGLKGAAADAYGMVTGRSLADWLRNAQRQKMAKADLDDPDVAEEPEIAREDSGVVFGRGVAPPQYPVRLSFAPAVAGQRARLWSGRPPRSEPVPINGGTADIALSPGLYVVDIPGSVRQGFEVTGARSADIGAAGPAVAEHGTDLFTLGIHPDDGATEIFVIDERFRLVDRNAGQLTARLPFGIYKVKTRLGRSVTEQIILLDRDMPAMRPDARPVASAAPLPNSRLTHEYHIASAAASLRKVHAAPGAGARLSVMARAWSESGQTRSDALPWDGVRVVDARAKIVADLSRDGDHDWHGDPVACCSLSVNPGTYFLRHGLAGGAEVEQSLIVPPGWFLHAYLLRLQKEGETGFKEPRLSFIMHRTDNNFFSLDDPRLAMLEAARVALADERRILSSTEMQELLVAKFDNPIAGIIGGHLLLIEQERDRTRDISVLDTVVENLRILVGTEHPDVEALSLRCSDPGLRRTKPVRTPPMFYRSWALLLAGSQDHHSLLPVGLWNRVQAHSTLPPCLVWAVDARSKQAAREALVNTMVALAARPDGVTEPSAALIVPILAGLPGLEAAAHALPLRAAARPMPKRVSAPRTTVSKKAIDLAMGNAARLQVPPSVLKSVRQDVIAKLKG
jgi:hypothetical protein